MKGPTKTVTGKLVSTKSISLSNAAKYISRFTDSDHGASHAVTVYLQRASDSFNSLVQFKKKLKGIHSRREEQQVSQPLELDAKVEFLGTADGKIKNSESKGRGKKNPEFELNKDAPLEIKQDKDGKNQIFEVKNEENSKIGQNPDGLAEKKKKKKSGKEKVHATEFVDLAYQSEKKKRSKADGNDKIKEDNLEVKGEMNRVEEGALEMKGKQKKRKKTEVEEAEKTMWGEEGNNMKSREVDGVDLTEQTGKKKKRRKIEVEGK